MWKPATYAVESFVSWFVNQVLIDAPQEKVTRKELQAWFEDFPAQNPIEYFCKKHTEIPVSHDWLQEGRRRSDGSVVAEFSFPSNIKTGCERNDQVQGQALLHPSRAHSPAVIMLHGWLTPGHQQSMLTAKELLKQGYSTYMMELPQHMRRSAKGKFSGSTFIHPDLRLLFGAIQQSVADLHKLMRLLSNQGHTQIHLMGISFGAYIATLAACAPPNSQWLQSLNLVMPLVDLGYTFAHSPILRKGRDLLQHHDITMEELQEFFAPLHTKNFRPLVPRERILLVNASHDQVSYAHKVRELWETWNYPHLFEEPQGHVSMFFARDPYRRIARHLAQYTKVHGFLGSSDTNPRPQIVLL